MYDFVDCFDYDNYYSVDLNNEIESMFAERDSLDLPINVDNGVRDVLGFGGLGFDAILPQSPNAVQNALTAPTPNILPSLARAELNAPRPFDPPLWNLEEAQTLGETTAGVNLIPRGRALHQYDADLYPFGQSVEDSATSESNKPIEDDSANIATKKRKASDGLPPANKTRKTGHNRASTTAPGDASSMAASNPRITTSMFTEAPQSVFVVGGPLPPPAAEGDTAKLSKIISMRTANSSNYNDLMQNRPPPNVCLPLNNDISVVELTIFFPNSVQIPKVATRLMRNGFKGQTVAKMQLDAVGDRSDKNAQKVEDKLKWQYKHAGECEWSHLKQAERTSCAGIAKSEGPHQDLTANHFKLRHEYPGWETSQKWGHWSLRSIYEPIEDNKWPQGADRLVVTQCLEFAKTNPQLDLDTSHWDWIAQHINAQPPPVPAGYATRDEEAAGRWALIHPTRQAVSVAKRRANGRSGSN